VYATIANIEGIEPLVPFTSDLDNVLETLSSHAGGSMQEAKTYLCRLVASKQEPVG